MKLIFVFFPTGIHWNKPIKNVNKNNGSPTFDLWSENSPPLYRMWEAYRQRYLAPTRGCKNDWWAQQRPKDACAARNQRRDSDRRNDNKLEIFFSVTARHWHSNSRTRCVGVIPPYTWSARNDTYFFIIGTTIFYIFRRKLKNIRYERVKNSRYTGFINNRYKL